ncbi:hypothetical protein CHARACLAT_003309 [Characodon lateralis]|uniref:Uncharacterized protein n=1 Tax=Characodon lateralis TaxID=208331 RepID=A0ABU7D3R8_9TELE|nr:hypothetical protein [Characodon lateralis]
MNKFQCSNHFHCCRCIISGVEKLDWSALSPDLNLLEHLWDELEEAAIVIFSSNYEHTDAAETILAVHFLGYISASFTHQETAISAHSSLQNSFSLVRLDGE